MPAPSARRQGDICWERTNGASCLFLGRRLSVAVQSFKKLLTKSGSHTGRRPAYRIFSPTSDISWSPKQHSIRIKTLFRSGLGFLTSLGSAARPASLSRIRAANADAPPAIAMLCCGDDTAASLLLCLGVRCAVCCCVMYFPMCAICDENRVFEAKTHAAVVAYQF